MKYSIKMIITDLDGTLLKSDKTISKHTKAVLNECREAGIKVVYATGRGESANKVAPAELFDGRITQNGAVIIANNSLFQIHLIPYEISRPLLMACDKYGLKIASENREMHYSNFIVSDEWPSITAYEIVDFARHSIDAEKLCVILNNPVEIAFVKKNLPNDLYLTVGKDGLGQIMLKGATKSNAAACLAQNWNISPSEILSFGDDLNDIDMLIYAGFGVAMGNALEEVKAAADYICLSNDEDGLAEWIIANIL